MAETDLQDQDVALSPEQAQARLAEELKKIIDVKVADIGTLRKSLTVTVPAERVAEERARQYDDILSEAVIPGFRRGRAPRALVEKRFGAEIGDQVLSKLVSNSCMAALDKEQIKSLGDPQFRIKVEPARREGARDAGAAPQERLLDITEALAHLKLPESGPLTFTCEVEVKPAFDLPALEGIPVKRPKVKITEEDVTNQINRIRAISGELVPVADGAVETDDMVIADVTISVGGAVVLKKENETLFARPRLVAGVRIEKLGDLLKGACVGDTRQTDVTLPDDFEPAEPRGKMAAIEFKIHDIKRLKLPPLDEAALKEMGFDSEKEYRDHVRHNMEHRLDGEIKNGMRGQVHRYLLENTKLDLPEGLSARQVERAVIRRVLDLRRRGVPQAEIEKHADELSTSARDQAITELKLFFILEKIAEERKIEISEEDINGQIAAIAQHYGRRFDRVRDELAADGGLETLYLRTRDDKCVDTLLEQAKIEDAAGPATSVAELDDVT